MVRASKKNEDRGTLGIFCGKLRVNYKPLIRSGVLRTQGVLRPFWFVCRSSPRLKCSLKLNTGLDFWTGVKLIELVQKTGIENRYR